MKEATIETLNITKGAAGTRLSQRKYDAVKKALLACIPRSTEGIEFRSLPKLIAQRVPADILPKKGSASWLTTTVKLDLEARGLIERIPDSRPQRLRRIARAQ